MQTSIATRNAVISVRIKISIVLFVGSDKAIGHFYGILKMHIVVGCAVYQKVITFQEISKIDWRIFFITVCIFFFGLHIAFGINRIVPLPIRNWRNRNGCFEYICALKCAQRRHITAITPTKNTDTRCIYVFECSQITRSRNLV